MGSMDSAFAENFEAKFEPDDFYESFLAPKFHDFTAPEEPIDPDAYFMAKPGMLKKAFAVEEVKTVAPKMNKVAAPEASKMVPVSQQQAPARSPVAAEKAAVSAGSAKKATRVVSTLLTPLASKSLKNGNSATNSPAQPPMLEKPGNGSLKPTSLAKKLQASENDDPNSPTNNSPDSLPLKVVKPALTRQRSQKVHEDKPALTRQRSQKFLEAKPTAVAIDAHSVQKASGDSCEVKSDSDKESDLVKAADNGTPQRKENSSKSVAASTGGAGAVRANSSALSTCKTPVKEPVSNQQEVKKPVLFTEVVGSPYSGHHCKSSRCAANDPNFSSPVPTKKYLIAKRGTPGSLRKATPNHAVTENCNEEALSENPGQTSSVEAGHTDASKVQGNTKVALEEEFQKMALDQSLAVVVEEQMTKQVTVSAVTELSKSEVEDLKEVPLGEDRSIAVPAQPLSAADVRAWAGRSVNFEDTAPSSSERTTTDTEKGTNAESKTTGINLFLQVASDCLENIDLTKLDLPQSKQGKKRKSGELIVAGASKRANCASDDTRNKAISKKISQVKDAAASKIPNKLKMRRLSVARRLSIARTNSRVTNPRPFRLRTQERGAVKEKEFIKKVEEYKAAKEGFYSAFQGLAVAEPKIPAKFLKSGHVFSAKRADPKTKDVKEGEAKSLKPPTHKALLFDHPFKPHRSTKKLTVPQEPKFHTVRSRTCPSHVAVPA